MTRQQKNLLQGVARPRRVLAFSLVELVIVVVIIAIIAAIAIPRLAAGSAAAAEAALVADLASLRSAIDMYAGEQHGGRFPGATTDGTGNAANSAGAFVNQLTKYSSDSGGVADVPDPSHPFGPYLRTIPPVPVGANKGSATVAVDVINSPPVMKPGTDGWVYNPISGEIIANTDAANRAQTRAYDEY